jgi:hypothetical protein
MGLQDVDMRELDEEDSYPRESRQAPISNQVAKTIMPDTFLNGNANTTMNGGLLIK